MTYLVRFAALSMLLATGLCAVRADDKPNPGPKMAQQAPQQYQRGRVETVQGGTGCLGSYSYQGGCQGYVAGCQGYVMSGCMGSTGCQGYTAGCTGYVASGCTGGQGGAHGGFHPLRRVAWRLVHPLGFRD